MIKKILLLFTDKTFMKFFFVGIINTIVGTITMFVLYNILNFGYWFSSASNYLVGSICSFFLNKYFTFKYYKNNWISLFRFTINIIICYLLAYGIAKPLIIWILNDTSITIQENISMAVGMCIFIFFNYLGQRCFAFKSNNYPTSKT